MVKIKTVYKTGNSKILLLLFLPFCEAIFPNSRNGKNSKGLGWVKALNTCENLEFSEFYFLSLAFVGIDFIYLLLEYSVTLTFLSQLPYFYLTPNRNVREITTEWGWFQSEIENIVYQLFFPCHISSWCRWNHKHLKSQHGEGLQSCVLEIKTLSRCNVYCSTKIFLFY